jgi:hypothetical protein
MLLLFDRKSAFESVRDSQDVVCVAQGALNNVSDQWIHNEGRNTNHLAACEHELRAPTLSMSYERAAQALCFIRTEVLSAQQ